MGGIALLSGANVLTVTARDAAGNISTDTLTVTYTPDTTAAGGDDHRARRANATLAVTASTLALSGTASDNVGVTQVSWANDRGGSGNASGTTSWSVSSDHAAVGRQRPHGDGARCQPATPAPTR